VSGVWQSPPRLLGLTSSHPGCAFTTPSCPCPFQAARQNGVWPSLSGLLGLTSFRPGGVFTTLSCALQADHMGGVLPVQPSWLISQPSTSAKPATISTTLKMDAQCRPPNRRFCLSQHCKSTVSAFPGG